MMGQMISAFIDNEMDLDEKVSFVEKLEKDPSLSAETLDLLKQEKLLQSRVVTHVPEIQFKKSVGWKHVVRSLFRPAALVASSFAGTVLLMLFLMPRPSPEPVTNRFVIYRPDVSKVEIAGTFTDWQRIPMHKIGVSGYWELSLELSQGEHRFTYILEGRQSFADPTITTRELDDFGGENSVLHVEHRT
jgi:hypothetical protein